MLTKPFEDTLVDMHDGEYSLPSIQVAVDRHMAMTGHLDVPAERQRIAAAFKAKRPDTAFSAEIVEIILGQKTA